MEVQVELDPIARATTALLRSKILDLSSALKYSPPLP